MKNADAKAKEIILETRDILLKEQQQQESEAREKLSTALDAAVRLDLVVKVKTDWSENPKELKKFGYLIEDQD